MLQSLTEDGDLTDVEIGQLHQWLNSHRDSDLPAIDFLVKTVEQILADDIVSTSERRELYRAIERVLPPEARQLAKEKRRESDKSKADHQVRRFYSKVKGVTAKNRGGGDRQSIIADCRAGEILTLEREPRNRYNKYAVLVRRLNGDAIGYLGDNIVGNDRWI